MTDKHEMVETIIKYMNEINVSGSKNVVLLSESFQMLFALQKGLKDEDKSNAKKIEILKEQLRNAGGADNGED